MKNRWIFLIPAALLLITTSVYAQVNSDFEQEFNNFNSQARQNFDSFTQQAQEEFNKLSNQINDSVQRQIEQDNSAINSGNCPCQYNDFDCVCGDDEYCKTHAQLLQKFGVSWDKIVNSLKNKENQKKALYKDKYFATTPFAEAKVNALEREEIKQLSSFEEVKDYVLDMPIKEQSLQYVADKLDSYYQGTKEEKAFIKSLIKALDKSEACPKDLDLETFGLENFCFLSRPDSFKSSAYVAMSTLETTLKK